MRKRVHVYYRGLVQGVGFRFTTQDLAEQLGVFGWVKNLRSGEVEILAEAEEEVLKNFLSKINKYFRNYIRDIDVEWSEATDDFKDFRIEF